MKRILNSVFRNITITDVERMLQLWENTNIEFWDLVELYRIDE